MAGFALLTIFFFDWVGTAEDLYLRKELSSEAVLNSLHLNTQPSRSCYSVCRSRHISSLAGPVPKVPKYLHQH